MAQELVPLEEQTGKIDSTLLVMEQEQQCKALMQVIAQLKKEQHRRTYRYNGIADGPAECSENQDSWQNS